MNSFHSRISAMLGICPKCHVDPCECIKRPSADAGQLIRELNNQLGKTVGLPDFKFRPAGSSAEASARAADISAKSAIQSATISAQAATTSVQDATISAQDATSPNTVNIGYPSGGIGYPPGGFVSSPKHTIAAISADHIIQDGSLAAKLVPSPAPKLPKDEFIPSWDKEEEMPEIEDIDDLPPASAPDKDLTHAVEVVRKRLADDVHHSIISNNFVLADKLMSMTAMEVFERYSEGSTT